MLQAIFLSLCVMISLVNGAFPLVTRDAPDVNEDFNLYAYGESVGGLSLFYASGMYRNHLYTLQ